MNPTEVQNFSPDELSQSKYAYALENLRNKYNNTETGSDKQNELITKSYQVQKNKIKLEPIAPDGDMSFSMI